jgi:hypothetical protein
VTVTVGATVVVGVAVTAGLRVGAGLTGGVVDDVGGGDGLTVGGDPQATTSAARTIRPTSDRGRADIAQPAPMSRG